MPLSNFLQKLLFVNEFRVKDGEIVLLKDKYIMLNAANLISLQEIDPEKLYGASKKSSKKDMDKMVKYANVYKKIKNQELKNIASLTKKIGKTDDGVTKTLETIFEVYGLGKLQIYDLDSTKKIAQIKIPNSTLAEGQKSDAPMCSITAGILAGIFSFIFNKDVDCIETKCRAMGDEFCKFEIK
jgi:predicted hydrocarbon binding protein